MNLRRLNRTGRRQAARARTESEERFRATFETAGVGMALVDLKGHCFTSNPALQRMLGYTADELSRMSFTEFTHPEDRDLDWTLYTELMEGKRDRYEIEKRYLRKDGQLRWGQLTVSAVRDTQHRPQYAVGMVQDITERKHAEQARRESEARYKDFVAHTHEGVWRFELDKPLPLGLSEQEGTAWLLQHAYLAECNLAHARNSGFSSPEEILNRYLGDLVPPTDAERHRSFRDAARNGWKLRTVEYEAPDARGELKWIRRTEVPILENGSVVRIWGTTEDISAHKRAEERRREYEKTVEGLEEMVALVDRHYCYVLTNRAFLNYHAKSRGEVEGRAVSDLVGAELFRNVIKPQLDRCFKGEVARYELQLQHPRLGPRDLLASLFPIEGHNGVERAAVILRDITDRKRAEIAVSKSEAKFRAVVENSNDGILFADRDAAILYRSPSYQQINGFTDEERVGHSGFETAHPEDLAAVREYWSQVIQHPGMTIETEYRIRHKDGSWRWVETTAQNLLDNPDIGQIVVASRDISERKRAEAELEDRLRFESLLAGLAGRFVSVSAEQIDAEMKNALCRVCDFFGLEMASVWQLSGTEPRSITLTYACGPTLGPETPQNLNVQELFPWCFGQVLSGQIVAISCLEDLPSEAVHDREAWCQLGVKSNLTIGLAIGGGPVVGALSFNSMQAERTWSEEVLNRLKLVAQMFSNTLARQRADRALRESEERFRNLFENATVGIYRTTPDGRILLTNPAMLRMLGYERFEDLAERNLETGGFEPGYSRQAFKKNIERNGVIKHLESSWRKRDGSTVFIRESAWAVRDQYGQVVYYDGIVEDITEKKRAEDEARLTATLLEAAAETTLDGILIVNETGHVLMANQRFLQIWNIPEDVPRSGPHLAFVEPGLEQLKDRNAFLKKVEYLYEHPAKEDREEIEFKDGRVFDRYSSPLIGSTGKYYGRIWYIHDITERRKAEEALRRSNVYLAAGEQLTHTGSWAWNIQSGELYWSDETYRIFGFDPKGLNASIQGAFLARIHPDDRPRIEEGLRHPPPQADVEYRIILPNGTIRFIRDIAYAVTDATGKVVERFGVASDITDRKRAEETLRESERRYRLLFERNLAGVFRMAMYGRILNCNQAMAGMLGLDSPPQVMTRPFREFCFTDDEHARFIDEVAKQERVTNFEMRLRRADGATAWVIANVSAVTEGPGELRVVEGSLVDITDRKEAEAALRASEERFRRIAETITEVFWTAAPDISRMLYVSPGYEQLWGRSVKSLYENPKSFLEAVHSQDRDRVIKVLENETEGKPFEHEYRIVRSDGSIRWILDRGFPVRDSFGKLACYVGVARDITAHKRAEEELSASEARFRSYFEQPLVGAAITSTEKGWIAANHRICEILGYSMQELAQTDWATLTHPDDLAADVTQFNRVLAGEIDGYSLDKRFTRKNGETVWTSISVRAIRKPDQTVDYICAMMQDITERKRAEAALIEERHLLHTLMDNLPDAMYFKDGESRLTRTNLAFAKWVSLHDPAQTLGKTDFDFFADEHARLAFADEREIMRTGQAMVGKEEKETWPDGRVTWVSTTKMPLRDAQGEIIGTFGISRDVTEQKQAEERLKASEERFRTAFMTSADGNYISTLKEGRFLEVNDRFAEILAHDREKLIGKSFRELGHVTPEERERFADEVRTKGSVRNVELQLRARNGRAITALVSASTLQASEEGLMLGVVRDITEQKQAHEALLRLRQAVDASGEVVFMTDAEGIFTFTNPEFTQLYGFSQEEVLGKVTPRILKSGTMDAERYVRFWNSLLAMHIVRGEITNKSKDGRLVTVASSVSPVLDDSGKISGYLAIQRDVTESKRLEHQYLQAQKMEAVGRLAAGVAHDFNNLLTIINGYSELLLEQLPPGHEMRDSVSEIKGAGQRATGLTRQLLAFSRQEIRTLSILNLNTLVADSVKMLKRMIGEDIELFFIPKADLKPVLADPSQLEQVLMNLAVNSRDAMPRGGKLTIETCNFRADQEYVNNHYPMLPGSYVELAVSDTGIGMSAETQTKIFEPFFTTKERGKGTGLGLATVYAIVKQCKGYIWVYSEEGRGTTFKIFLPVVEAVPEPAQHRMHATGGSETIILVEDDDNVRAVAGRILGSRGYNVLEAPSGLAALLMPGEHKGPIHLLLTDLVMPVMSGRELAEKLVQSVPGLKVLYMSGYTDDAAIRHGVLQSGVPFLQKPFSPEGLARKVREVLDLQKPEP